MNPVRRLAAILAADVAGYSRLIGQDEEGRSPRFAPERFDGSLADVFDLQDQVAISVAGVTEPLQAAEMRRSGGQPTTDPSAYELYLKALAVFFPTIDRFRQYNPPRVELGFRPPLDARALDRRAPLCTSSC